MFKKKILTLAMAAVMAVSLCVPAMAAGFAPSVEAKPAPEAGTITHEGESVGAVIKNEKGEVLATVKAEDVKIVALANSKDLPEEKKKELDNAYDQLTKGDILTVCPAIKDTMAEDVKAENLVVRDLFDISLPAELDDKVAGGKITLALTVAGGTKGIVAVMHNTEADKWESISGDNLKIVDENTIEVTFNGLSPVALVYDAVAAGVEVTTGTEAEEEEEEESKAPLIIGIVLAVVIIGGALVAYLISQKSKKDENEDAENDESDENNSEDKE